MCMSSNKFQKDWQVSIDLDRPLPQEHTDRHKGKKSQEIPQNSARPEEVNNKKEKKKVNKRGRGIERRSRPELPAGN